MSVDTVKKGFYLLFFSVLIAFIWQSYFMSKAPSPKYEILSSSDNIELRKYPELILAGVAEDGPRKVALSHGFKQLSDYIFGNNMPADGSSHQGVKVEMTAPVVQHGNHMGNKWDIFFIMPEEYCLGDLPIPNNHNVKLTEQHEQKILAIRFSGFNSDSNLNKHLHELQAYAAHHNIHVRKEIVMAYYDPPWVLPFIRRNEIWLQVK